MPDALHLIVGAVVIVAAALAVAVWPRNRRPPRAAARAKAWWRRH